jgi:protoheme IX farnesyltransferase
MGLKVKSFFHLLKFRLTTLVAISSVFGYAIAAGPLFVWWHLIAVAVGGIFVTGAANVLNQVIEKEYDKLMRRTSNRPLPSGVLSSKEAVIYALVLTVLGISILGGLFNLVTALLSLLGLLLYAFVYTPLKRISPISVFVGAIPGALPPMIGWVAVMGELSMGAWILFAFQFFWQFPHFWAIAWVQDEDYQRAGFKMLPTSAGKTEFCAMLIMVYTLCLIPMVVFPFSIGMIGWVGAIGLVVLGIFFGLPAIKLFKTLDDKVARKLMFASFLYLPLSQILFLVG